MDNDTANNDVDNDEPTDECVSRVLRSVPSLPTFVLGPTSPVRVRMTIKFLAMIWDSAFVMAEY